MAKQIKSLNSTVEDNASSQALVSFMAVFKTLNFSLFKNHSFLTVCPSGFVRLGIYLPHVNSRSPLAARLSRRSAAARLLRLWVRIPPGAWMFVLSVVCCQVEVSATS
jgi:hypothetical protein